MPWWWWLLIAVSLGLVLIGPAFLLAAARRADRGRKARSDRTGDAPVAVVGDGGRSAKSKDDDGAGDDGGGGGK